MMLQITASPYTQCQLCCSLEAMRTMFVFRVIYRVCHSFFWSKWS